MWDSLVSQFEGDKAKVLKGAGLVLLALIVVLVVGSAVTGTRYGGLMPIGEMDYEESVTSMPGSPLAMPAPGGYGKGYDDGASLSYRNVVSEPMPPQYGGYTSGDSEAFEVREYHAQIETRSLGNDCGVIEGLKARQDVIFESSNEYDRGCSYTFKVAKESVTEVLAVIDGLNPKNVSENVYTIKREVDDYTSEIDIYRAKLATLDKTLADALASYENVTDLATRTGDVESLAKIIESKLTLIERLTSARVQAQSELDRITRAKTDSLDRLMYTYMTVSITEEVFVDREALIDSWKASVRELVWEVNRFLGDITIGFVGLLFLIVKVALYGIVILFAVRFGWKFVKGVWQ